MKNNKRITALIVITMSCLLSVGIFDGATGYAARTARALETKRLIYSKSYDEKLKEAEEKKKQIEKDKKDTKNKLDELKKTRDDLIAYIEELDMQAMALDDKIRGYENDIKKAEAELEITRVALDNAKKAEKEQYESMKKRIKYMYENGNRGYLEIFLNAKSISDILNQMEYFSKITEYDNELLDNYTLAKLEVENQEAMLELDIENLDILAAAAKDDREILDGLIADKNEKIIEYTEKIGVSYEMLSDYGEQLAKADADIEAIKEEERLRREEEERRRREEEERIKREQKEKENEIANNRLHAAEGIVQTDITDPNYMIWPLPGDGRIYAYFGYRKAPTAGASTYHQGLDIGGEYGASIVASLAGKVTEAAYNRSRGNYVTINHGNGIETLYMHCSKLLVNVGDYVKQGSVIALVGSTGISTGPHVHFSVRVNGINVDPLIYVSYN